MAPGVDGLPPVAGPGHEATPDGAIEIAEPINRYLASMPHRGVRQLRLALRALDLFAFPRRFSRASLAARQRFLVRLDRSRLPFASDLMLFLTVVAGLCYGS